jgi:hypothetical protein
MSRLECGVFLQGLMVSEIKEQITQIAGSNDYRCRNFSQLDGFDVLIAADQPRQLHASLVRVLSDADYRKNLAARSRSIFQAHFAWPSIAARFASLLKPE